jgi:hypothetical protein
MALSFDSELFLFFCFLNMFSCFMTLSPCFLLIGRLVLNLVAIARNFILTSTFSYIVIGFTNIRILNGTMQRKVLKISIFLKIFFIPLVNRQL